MHALLNQSIADKTKREVRISFSDKSELLFVCCTHMQALKKKLCLNVSLSLRFLGCTLKNHPGMLAYPGSAITVRFFVVHKRMQKNLFVVSAQNCPRVNGDINKLVLS